MGVLDGKVAIITGSGGGIGREHALLFAREGAKVVVNDPGGDVHGKGEGDMADQVVAEIKKAGGAAVANKDAVGTFDSAQKILKTAIDTYGKVDVLVNNAGILRDKTIINTTEDEWDLVLKVHLKGTFTLMQVVAKQMKEQGTGGRIINTSSSSGLLGNFGQGNYGAAKAGVYALTRIGSWELGKYNITVNGISPAAHTRMTADLPGAKDQDVKERLKTFGPQHISPIVAYLASDAGANINGQTFGVEGNRLFVYKMLTSHGAEKRSSDDPWTQDELAKSIDRIVSW